MPNSNGQGNDESFKFRALSAGAVMAFDGQTDSRSPVEHDHLDSNLTNLWTLTVKTSIAFCLLENFGQSGSGGVVHSTY